MHLTWKDARYRGISQEILQALPNYACLDDLFRRNGKDFLEETRGRITWEFDDIEAVDEQCNQYPVEQDYETILWPSRGQDLSVHLRATRLAYTAEERAVTVRGEILNYFHYRVTYSWARV